jgi:hypothetical protein
MPSLSHEALLLLFRYRPELAAELLRDALHVTLPAYSEVRLESADLTDVSPAEYRADTVILLVDGKPVLGIVLEVQLASDPDKRFTWPVYVAGLRARLKCPACVLVVTPSEAVAEWCRKPIELGPGSALSPLVIGPAYRLCGSQRPPAKNDSVNPIHCVRSASPSAERHESDVGERTNVTHQIARRARSLAAAWCRPRTRRGRGRRRRARLLPRNDGGSRLHSTATLQPRGRQEESDGARGDAVVMAKAGATTVEDS